MHDPLVIIYCMNQYLQQCMLVLEELCILGLSNNLKYK